MKCPKCRTTEMNPETFHRIDLDRCPDCMGIFFDRGELDAVLDRRVGKEFESMAVAPEAGAQRDRQTAHCSRCDRQMRPAREPGGVRFDWCPGCGGIYLDRGELSRLQDQQDDNRID